MTTGTNTPHGNSPPRSSGATTALAWTVAVVALFCVFVALLQPRFAQRLALIVLVVGSLAVLTNWLRRLWASTTHQPERLRRTTERQQRKAVKRRAASEQERANQDGPIPPSPDGPIPLAVAELSHPYGPAGLSPIGQRHLQLVVTECLWERHRLNLADPNHLPSVTSIVSPQLQRAIGLPVANNWGVPNVPLASLLRESETL